MKRNLAKNAFLCIFAACMMTACDDQESTTAHIDKDCSPACENGLVCSQGVCVEQGPGEDELGDSSCIETGCPVGKLCIHGVCTDPDDVECNEDKDCPGKSSCEKHTCVDSTDCSNKTCPEGQKCVLGDCIEITCQDTGCPDGQECNGTTCQIIDPCQNKLCGEKEQCENGECKPILCGGIVCGDTQTCFHDVCHENSEFCGEEICTDTQKCDNNACREMNACDSTNCPQGQTCFLAASGLPICYTTECLENGAVKTCAEGTSCVAGECVATQINTIDSCDNGYLRENGQCIVPLKSIAIAVGEDVTGSVDVMLESTVQLKVIYDPPNTTERDVTWKGTNVTPNEESKAITEYVNASGLDTDTLTLKGISTLAGEIDIKVTSNTHEDIEATAKAYIKPYFALRHNDYYDDIKKYRKGALKCNYYNEYNLAVFNRDLYEKFVQPKMIAKEVDGKLVYYPTRASVVAAIRFLAMQFPFTFPYRMADFDGNSITMISHFAWTKYDKADNPDDVRIYGLNLTSNVYNSHTNEKVISTKSTPWACTQPKGSKPIGLECSGFVAWSLRNGRFNAGDWKTSMFADSNFNKKSETKAWGFNGNNVHDNVIEKFKDLNTANDYIEAKKVKDDEIHAGDVLWHGTYKKDDGTTGSGHVAIVAGVARDDAGKVKYVYVSEATSSSSNPYGNHTTRYTFGDFKSSKWAGTSKYKCYLIRMDKVYSYATKKYGLEEDSNAYDDFW
ncbi:MAG: hypothetical protein J6A01_10290 [Proteobacteria bacterium]|nr:hypothetical protein [Pseudomonadota bacterium]